MQAEAVLLIRPVNQELDVLANATKESVDRQSNKADALFGELLEESLCLLLSQWSHFSTTRKSSGWSGK